MDRMDLLNLQQSILLFWNIYVGMSIYVYME